MLDPGVVIGARIVKHSNDDVSAFIVETAGFIDIFDHEYMRKFGFVGSVDEICSMGPSAVRMRCPEIDCGSARGRDDAPFINRMNTSG